MTVSYSTRALVKRFVGRSGGLQFVTAAPLELVTEATRQAAINALPEMTYEGPALVFDGVGAVSGGPVIALTHCDTSELLEQFLSALVASLEGQGFSGRLAEAPRVERPQLWAPAMTLATVVTPSWETVLGSRPRADLTPEPGWWVDPESTERVLTPLAQWCLEGAGEVLLQRETGTMPVDRASAARLLVESHQRPEVRSRAALSVIEEPTSRLRKVTVLLNGHVLVHSRDPEQPWDWHFREVSALGQLTAEDLDNASVQVGNSEAAGRYELLKRPQSIVQTGSNTWTYAHLEDEFLFDVRGSQIVTDKHLRRIGSLDPDRWRVESLAGDRYVITSLELSGWLDVKTRPYSSGDTPYQRPEVPNEAILEQARRDFAGVLVTWPIVDEHPRPVMKQPYAD